jgi:PAS domain S-box-containing protein
MTGNDQKESQRVEGLEITDKLFRLFVERVKDYAIFLLDARGGVITWNAGAEALKGYRRDEIIGRHFSCFYGAGDVARGKPNSLLATAEDQGRVEDEGWRVRKNGSRFWANVVITALRDDQGRVTGFAKITRDLTERRQANQLLEQRVHERTTELLAANAKLTETNQELEAFHQAVVGRELKIIALEKRLAELEAALKRAGGTTGDRGRTGNDRLDIMTR